MTSFTFLLIYLTISRLCIVGVLLVFCIQPEIENGHAFLILGRDDNTMILQTGNYVI